ncbi:hypothetical protein SporoP37_15830 [Sporosarcina sp. P37]|uniref:head decoration protein n=1 Tax=unclassified Sporosarcina TaxID=2647733 RepID=UPI000A17BDA7|nr:MULTISPECIES: head decoration protein [unclassified Sporosarcina]ARK25996.1 hypothetical protein SporoP37_15830 [Sporosarcina sp. P37]PID19365.1 hypothetical protein CSV62_02355 [Sporosarcina sp. P35]
MARYFEYENLLAGYQSHVVTEAITVAAEQELSVGQVFALNEASEAVAVSGVLTADDVYGIMADAVATAAGETKKAVGYVAGEFNANKIILPADADAASYRVALRNKGIYLRTAIAADVQGEE